MPNLRDSYLGQAWLVLILAAVFGGILAGVHTGLNRRIEANKRNETLSRIPELILGSELDTATSPVLRDDRIEVKQTSGAALELRVEELDIEGHQVFRITDVATASLLGWVARGAGPGYADQIEILVGLRPDGSELSGLYVLSQKETPALGDGITRPGFRQRFVGAPTDRALEVAKSESIANENSNRILALTAATISSRSVCDIVNRTVADIQTGLED